jgi:hypothetical protein
MLVDVPSFVHSLAKSAVVRAAAQPTPLALVYNAGAASNLWRNQGIEQPGNQTSPPAPYGVLRVYGGSNDRTNPKPTINLQMEIIAGGNDAGMAFAQGLFEAVALDIYGRELRQFLVDGYLAATDAANGTWMIVDAVTINRPGQVGRDDRNRVKIVGNVSIGFYKAS